MVMDKMKYIIISIYFGAIISLVSSNTETARPKVLIPNPTVPPVAIKILEEKCDVILLTNDSKANVLDRIKDVEAVLWNIYYPFDKEIIDAAGKLKMVASMSAGYNHFDIDELKKRNISLSNTPAVLNEAVADIGVLLALAASRRLHEAVIAIRKNAWEAHNNQWLLGQDITNSTVGVIGLGRIGQTLVKRLKGFSVNEFLYSGHREKPEGKELGAKFVSQDDLVKNSDFIFVVVPLTNETNGMCDEEFFSKMKKTAIFINISRAQVVDQEALKKALKNKTIFAAGLDVTIPEPLPPNDELLDIPNLVITPHIGSATVNTRNTMAELAANNILKGLNGEPLLTPVEF